MLSYLNDIDTSLFLFLNSFHSDFWDVVFVWITGKWSWVPLYLFLVVLVAFKFKWKALYVYMFIVLLIFIADKTSVYLFKEMFERLRPSHNDDLADVIYLVNDYRGGQYGFVSSHAANTFSLATFLGLLLRKYYKIMFPFLLLWATLVAYSRIYLGVHYPGDILGGAALGGVVGVFVYLLLKYLNQWFKLEIKLLT